MDMRRMALFGVAILGAVIVATSVVEAAAYRRPSDAATPGSPVPSYGGQSSGRTTPSGYPAESDVSFAWNGMEGPAYGYGYSLNLPADGNWRWIEPRCYSSRSGQTCVEGHWIRRQPGRCEEVSGHSVRTGQYIRIVPTGPVSTCRR